ncbi:DUF411 family protein [Natronomonas pharaonis DSM 2160]|uniref:DUF411 family protein n=1 Tax=Natronomonas pharaonis (strain ATCC 35678 / DSM 2160 / CIP 103997 / JCM 8858 / NBRC 14720 / NCIMB 2260 / Gabara) TaxID=348780 RepID=A0A1U7ETJ4_NATPD|nr:DUF411 domain-containing protein [Natronomonas pharaonis]CAI48216.1 DUF411 family protein [Natronomonas pharaonis DSM 2160]
MELSRRSFLATSAVATAGFAGCTGDSGDPDPPQQSTGTADWTWDGDVPVDSVVQYHQPSCGCCGEYVDYLERNGIAVSVEERPDFDSFVATKADLGVPESMRSCHTIEFGSYLVEGHVPLSAIERLFDDEAAVAGLAIPGMPQHAPGMGPPSDDPLTVYAFDDEGTRPFDDV